MPKNKGKGGKGKRRGKRTAEGDKRDLRYAGPSECYARAQRILGNCRVECFCYDKGILRLGKIRGKFKKRVWINKDDIILVSLRDYQDDRCDIVYKYNQDEIRRLRRLGDLPQEDEVDKEDEEEDEFDEFGEIMTGEDELLEAPFDPYAGLEEFDSSYEGSDDDDDDDDDEDSSSGD